MGAEVSLPAALLASRAIKKLTSGVRMAGVARRLIDEMDEHPAELGSVSLAGRCVERQLPDCSVGCRCSLAIGRDGISDGQLGTGRARITVADDQFVDRRSVSQQLQSVLDRERLMDRVPPGRLDEPCSLSSVDVGDAILERP